MMKKKRTRKSAPKAAVPVIAPPAEEIENEEVQNGVEDSVDQSVEENEEIDGEAEEVEAEDEAERNRPRRPEAPKIINDRDGLTNRYEDIILGSGRSLPWLERLEIITPECIAVSANDDLALEAAFYAQALQSVDRAIDSFAEQGYQWRRPDDYFAEMLKTDEHMQKVRAQLLSEKTNLEASVEKRKQREIKKYGKEVQRKRQEEKQKSKKVQLDAVKKWRQDRKMSGGADGGGEDFDVGILDDAENKESKKRKAPSTPNKSRKRQAKDEKFGFGGKKRGTKKNTAESAADLSTTYRGKRGGKPAGRGGRGGGAGGRGGGAGGRGGGAGGRGGKRPGKSSRQAGRGRA